MDFLRSHNRDNVSSINTSSRTINIQQLRVEVTHSIKFGGEVGCFLILIVQLVSDPPANKGRCIFQLKTKSTSILGMDVISSLLIVNL